MRTVFGQVKEASFEWSDFVKIFAFYNEIAGPAEAMLLNVELEPVCKNTFIGLQCRESASIVPPNLDIAPENGPGGRGLHFTKGRLKPVAMRPAVRVDKG